MSQSNGTAPLPMYNGKVNQSALVRDYLSQNPDMTNVGAIRGGIRHATGQLVSDNVILQVLSNVRLGKIKIPQAKPATPHNRLNGISMTPLATPTPAVQPLPSEKTNAVEVIRLSRLLITAAGDKDAAKEVIDLL